ncbi:hypothetical protein D3C84_751890 [compost metagenome]
MLSPLTANQNTVALPSDIMIGRAMFPALMEVAFRGTLVTWRSGTVEHPQIDPTATTNASEDTIFIVMLPLCKDALK